MVHVTVDYDYRFLTTPDLLTDILYVLKHWFYNIHQRNLDIFGVDYLNLKDFTTTKKDAQKHVSRKPPRNYLLKDENLFHKKKSQSRKKSSKKKNVAEGNF